MVRAKNPPLIKAVAPSGQQMPGSGLPPPGGNRGPGGGCGCGSRGLPVLLRQYLKLGDKILGFNED